MKKILNITVPFWVALALVFFLVLGMFVLSYFFRENIFRYNLSVRTPEGLAGGALKYGEQSALSNPDFFKKVKDDFIAQQASFVEADLSAMVLRVYQEGVVRKEVPILTKGREGSWWETPAGIYKIETKEKDHFSSFGHVHQPWSMAFQGNFFIHGWPYYPDGSPVSSKYSGGCIRLSTEDAAEVYTLISVGMPVLVFEKDFEPDGFHYMLRTPDFSGEHYLVVDLKSNYVFAQKGSAEEIPMGKFSQLLSALVATEYVNMEREMTVGEIPLMSTSTKNRLREGQEVTPFDLLHLMLLESSDEPAQVIGDHLGSKRMVGLMNAKAKAIGMNDTQVGSLSGREEASSGATTAEDLFYLAKYVYSNRNFIFKISSGKLKDSVYGQPKIPGLENKNIFAYESSFVGGKTILNNDGTESVFAVFEISVRGETRPIFVFLDHSLKAQEEVASILGYIQGNY